MFKKSPALFLLIFIVGGILIADYFRIDVSWFFFLLVLSVIVSLLSLKSNRVRLCIFFIGVGLLSFTGLRFASLYYETGVTHISNFIDSKTSYIIYGQVTDWPELKLERTELLIDVDSIESQSVVPVSGKILLKINSPTTQFQRGDYLVFKSRVYTVDGKSYSKDFNYNRFLRYKGVNGVAYQTTALYVLHDKANQFSVIPLVDYIRDAIKNSLYENLSSIPAALASGFLIGETRDIPPELYKRFKDSGTLHLLAVSGSNVILVVTFFSFLLNPFSITRKKRSLILIVIVILFSLLSYGEPSVVRASIMAALVLVAGVVERRYELVNIIAVAAFLILIYQPSQLFDLGFQLSFVIAWGLILVVPAIHQLFKKYHLKNWYKFLLLPLIVSSIAQLFSIGLIGLYFKQIPLLSPIANLFIVPLVSIDVIGVLALLVADFILPLLGLFVGSLLNLILEFTVYIVEVFGAESMPLLFVHDWTILGVSFLYLLLFMIPFAIVSKSKRRIMIYLILVGMNIVFINKIASAYFDADSFDVVCMNIPGGNMAIINPIGKNVDVLINSIKGKNYKIDEKIISPQIESEKVNKINKLIILKADFSAIDDILRLSEKYQVNSIWVVQNLENSFIDQMTNLHKEYLLTKLFILQSENSEIEQLGYVFSNNSLSLSFANYKLIFTERILATHFQETNNTQKIFLIVGSTWNITNDDYQTLKCFGYQAIICSKVAHHGSDENLQEIAESSGFVIDLYKLTKYRIKLQF